MPNNENPHKLFVVLTLTNYTGTKVIYRGIIKIVEYIYFSSPLYFLENTFEGTLTNNVSLGQSNLLNPIEKILVSNVYSLVNAILF